jgi:TetR/AcrR family acrAB operon transcriptional repressor
MARRTKAEAEQTRQQILKAALDLFVEKGYERATFEDVAGRIGLSKGAVYWHFKSKPDLFAALVEDMTAKHNAQIAALLAEPVSLEGLVSHFVARAELLVSKPINRKFIKMMFSMDWPAAKFVSIKRRLRESGTGPFELIEKTLATLQQKDEIRKGADIATISAALGALWLGAMKMQIDQCLDADLSASIKLGFTAIINTIRA